MSNKIFVSYKYWDHDVQKLEGYTNKYLRPKVRDYVDYLMDIFEENGNTFKGEEDGVDLSDKSDQYIENQLKPLMFNSSVTVVLISPNMKEPNKWERNQWIPWEISYSIRRTQRNERTSDRNMIIGVVLPNSYGSYSYYENMQLFSILKENIDNGYIYVTSWRKFINNIDLAIAYAEDNKRDTPEYLLKINVG